MDGQPRAQPGHRRRRQRAEQPRRADAVQGRRPAGIARRTGRGHRRRLAALVHPVGDVVRCPRLAGDRRAGSGTAGAGGPRRRGGQPGHPDGGRPGAGGQRGRAHRSAHGRQRAPEGSADPRGCETATPLVGPLPVRGGADSRGRCRVADRGRRQGRSRHVPPGGVLMRGAAGQDRQDTGRVLPCLARTRALSEEDPSLSTESAGQSRGGVRGSPSVFECARTPGRTCPVCPARGRCPVSGPVDDLAWINVTCPVCRGGMTLLGGDSRPVRRPPRILVLAAVLDGLRVGPARHRGADAAVPSSGFDRRAPGRGVSSL